MKLLYFPQPTETGSTGAPPSPGKPTFKGLQARLAEAEAKNARHDAECEQAAKDETVIRDKMDVGLTREQAQSVIKRQRDHGVTRQKAYDERRATQIEARKQKAL